jgi:hypothetical protein
MTLAIEKMRIGLRQTPAAMNHPTKVKRPSKASVLPRANLGSVIDVITGGGT